MDFQKTNTGDPITGGDSIISQINVTPFVDVALVLLVIFIVTAPTYLKDVFPVNLPKISKGDNKTLETLGVSITGSGQILLQGQLISDELLSKAVKEKLSQNPELQGVIAADEESKHRDLVRVMDLLKQSGLRKFAVQVEVKQEEP